MSDGIADVMRRAVVLGTAVGLAIGVVTGLVGLVVAGGDGLLSGLVGAVLTVVFLGVTAVGVLAAGRLTRGDGTVAFVWLLGGWFVKLALFVVAMLVVRSQPWVVPGVLLVSIIGTVLASLVIDSVVVGTARIPVTDRI